MASIIASGGSVPSISGYWSASGTIIRPICEVEVLPMVELDKERERLSRLLTLR